MTGAEFMKKWGPRKVTWDSFEYNGDVGMSARLAAGSFAVRVPRGATKAESRAAARAELDRYIESKIGA